MNFTPRNSVVLISQRLSLLRKQAFLIQNEQHRHKSIPARQLNAGFSKLITIVQDKANWANQQYERYTGISHIREMQAEVLEAESGFVDITKSRKSCQDQIDNLKSSIKALRDKLDSTPRESEVYVDLIRNESKLLREQLVLDVQLSQLKEKEQLSLNNLSRLLRRSHEQERLRQEKSKYLQMISVLLSLAGSSIAYFAQSTRNQNSVMRQLNSLAEHVGSYEVKLAEIERLIQNDIQQNQLHSQAFQSSIEKLCIEFDGLAKNVGYKPKAETGTMRSGWTSYIPGLPTVISWFNYYI